MMADRRALVVNLALPLVITLIMGLSFGGGLFGRSQGISAIPVAMVAEELPGLLRDRLAQGLTESGFFTVTWADSAGADRLVREGKAAAAVVLPPGFLDKLLTLEPVAVQVWKDPGSQLKADIVQQILTRSLARYQAGEAAYLTLWPPAADDDGDDTTLRDLFAGDFADIWQRLRAPGGQPGGGSAGDRLLLELDRQAVLTRVLGKPGASLVVQDKSPAGAAAEGRDVNLFNYFLPSFSVFFLMFAVSAACRDLQREQKAGTLQRQLLTPVRRQHFLVGKWLSAAAQGVLMLGTLFLVGSLLYRVNLGPDPLALVLAVVLCCTAAAGVFLLLAVLSPSEKFMDNLTTIVILVSAMLGGNMIPLENLQPWMTAIGRFGFNYWANLAFLDIMVKDRGLAEVTRPLLVLAIGSVVLLAANLVAFRLKSRRGGLS